MRAYYERSSHVPACPVCHGRHHTATNGAGRRVHCDGSHAETDGEQAAREAAERLHRLTAERRTAERDAERKEERATKRREQRARTKRRDAIRAERTARADAPAIDAIDIGRLPDRW